MKEYFENYKESIDKDPLEFWSGQGMLDLFSNIETKTKAANAYSIMAKWLYENRDNLKEEDSIFGFDFTFLTHFIIRGIFLRYPEAKFTDAESLYNYIVWYYYHYLDYYVKKKTHITWITIANECTDSIIEELKDNKKIKEKEEKDGVSNI